MTTKAPIYQHLVNAPKPAERPKCQCCGKPLSAFRETHNHVKDPAAFARSTNDAIASIKPNHTSKSMVYVPNPEDPQDSRHTYAYTEDNPRRWLGDYTITTVDQPPQYHGYERVNGTPLFCSTTCCKKFAAASWRGGYRLKGITR